MPDDSDTTSTSSTTAIMETAEATSPAAPPESETSTPTTQPETEAQATSSPATTPPDASAAAKPGSLTTDQRSPPPSSAPSAPAVQQPPPAAPVDWEQRYKQAEQFLGRIQRENADHRKYRESQEREAQERRREAETQALKPWHPKHPDFLRNEQRMARVQSFMAARDVIRSNTSLDENGKRAQLAEMAERMGVSADDAQLYRDHQQHVQEAHQSFARDPAAFIQSHVERVVQNHLAHYDQTLRAQAGVEQWLQDPQHKKVLETNAADAVWAMSDQTPRRQVGVEFARLKAENAALKAQMTKSRETVETANAQNKAMKKRATVTRDASTTSGPNEDPVSEGQKQGLSGAALAQFLSEKRRAANET